ncbi:MAG: two-component sensor histidine kinase, partial [Shinella sp.]
MKLRHALAFAVLPIVILLAVLQGGALLTRSYMDEASSQAGSALRLAVAALAGHLSRYEPLPALIADHDDIEALLQSPESPALRQTANEYLKEINRLLESSDIYVMTPDGNTVAASNYGIPGTFVGQNFNYRPYFQDAIAGRQARFYALGTT